MSTVSRFVTKFASLIVCTLHCFDRVIFKGHLPMARPSELERFVDYVLKVRRSHFMKVLAPEYSDALVKHAQRLANKLGRKYLYRTGSFRKDQWAEQLLRENPIDSGLIGVLCTLETCNSFALVYGENRPRFISRPRQQRVLYYYFLDSQLGLIHVRLQTWAPFTFQVYVNGHDWLAQQMTRLQMGFVLKGNAFTQLDEPAKAQRQADRFARLDWTKILNRYARQVNPLAEQGVEVLSTPLVRGSGRIRHRSSFSKPRCSERVVSKAPAVCGRDVPPQRHLGVPRPQVGSPLRRRRA